MLKKPKIRKHLFYAIPLTLAGFIFLGISIFNFSGITNLVSNNFYNYISQDIQDGKVAGESDEYPVRMAQASVDSIFNQNKQAFIDYSAQRRNDMCSSNHIMFYGWLEKIRQGDNSYRADIDNFVDFIFDGQRYYECDYWVRYMNATGAGPLWDYIFAELFFTNLIDIATIYPDELGQDNVNRIISQYRNFLSRNSKMGTNGNHQTGNGVAQYLYALLYDQNLNFNFAPDVVGWINRWSYNGNTYEAGNTYKHIDFWRDYLQLRYNHITKKVSDGWYTKIRRELDASYSQIYMRQFHILYDLLKHALDNNQLSGQRKQEAEIIKGKTKMVLDFMYLDGGLDSIVISGDDIAHGGPRGRSSLSDIYENQPAISSKPFFDAVSYPNNGENNNLFVTSYRMPELIRDVIDLRDEDKYYYQIHKEFQSENIMHMSNTGKFNFMARDYSLGSSNRHWELNLREQTPFKLWINKNSVPNDIFTRAGEINTWGTNGVQYNNALLVKDLGSIPYLHIITGRRGNTFDNVNLGMSDTDDWGDLEFVPIPDNQKEYYDQYDEYFNTYRARSGSTGWMFFKKNDTAIAIRLGSQYAAVEVVTLGKNAPPYYYQNFDDFKSAVNSTAKLGKDYFVTSTGLRITPPAYDPLYIDTFVVVNGEDKYPTPFKRIETIGPNGEYILENNNDVITVSKHNKTCIYNFNNWTYSGDCGSEESSLPPNPYCGDGICNGDENNSTCPADCKISPSHTCQDLNGYVCSQNQTCPGSFISAANSSRCCPQNCVNPTNTCSFLSGSTCQSSQFCDIDYLTSSDNNTCCPNGHCMAKTADLNCSDNDNRVNFKDLVVLVAYWGNFNKQEYRQTSFYNDCGNTDEHIPDMNGDGEVGLADFTSFLSQWGK